MLVKAILFDCDGTLVDSEYAHYLSWKKALEHVGGDFSLEEYYPYVGKSADINASLLAKRVGKDCSHTILQTKSAHYKDLCIEKLPSIDATVDFLRLLGAEKQKLNIKLGVCSAAGKKEILSHLHHLGVLPLLDIVLSGQEDLKEYEDPEGVNKPKPYIYLEALKQLAVAAKECIVIEDSASGIASAISAGCFAIAVPNDYTRTQDLSGANLRIDSFLGMDISSFFRIVSGI
ncbi:MAG: HAD family phosphatase [Rhabdochlamydiaceae bacterium]|nr:HAD family phosphatase [Rhabdochlamydiaceae bacterium]